MALTRKSRLLYNNGNMGQSLCSYFDMPLLPSSPQGAVWKWWGILPQRDKTEFFWRASAERMSNTHEPNYLLMLLTAPGWGMIESYGLPLLLHCLPALGPVQFAWGTQLHTILINGRGGNASCLHLLLEPQSDGEKLSQGEEALWRRALAASCIWTRRSPKAEGCHLHYKCWKMGNLSSTS